MSWNSTLFRTFLRTRNRNTRANELHFCPALSCDSAFSSAPFVQLVAIGDISCKSLQFHSRMSRPGHSIVRLGWLSSVPRHRLCICSSVQDCDARPFSFQYFVFVSWRAVCLFGARTREQLRAARQASRARNTSHSAIDSPIVFCAWEKTGKKEMSVGEVYST